MSAEIITRLQAHLGPNVTEAAKNIYKTELGNRQLLIDPLNPLASALLMFVSRYLDSDFQDVAETISGTYLLYRREDTQNRENLLARLRQAMDLLIRIEPFNSDSNLTELRQLLLTERIRK